MKKFIQILIQFFKQKVEETWLPISIIVGTSLIFWGTFKITILIGNPIGINFNNIDNDYLIWQIVSGFVCVFLYCMLLIFFVGSLALALPSIMLMKYFIWKLEEERVWLIISIVLGSITLGFLFYWFHSYYKIFNNVLDTVSFINIGVAFLPWLYFSVIVIFMTFVKWIQENWADAVYEIERRNK